MTMSNEVSKALTAEFNRRIFEESVPKIEYMLGRLSLSEIWHKDNIHSNSIGHLILHLCGNVRQWICSGIMGEKDVRKRSLEFDSSEKLNPDELIGILYALKSDTDRALDSIEDVSLLTTKRVQGYDETILSIIIHVIEHFSYHTGQIAVITKHIKNIDLKFYSDRDLNVIGQGE